MQLLDSLNQIYHAFTLDELRLMNENTLYPNITYNSLLYLELIYYREDCTVSQLAELLCISKSAVTIKVGELIRQGLVTKTRSESDRRVFYLSVSPEVKADYGRYNKKLLSAVEALKQQYSPTEVETFCRMLDLIRESYLEQLPDAHGGYPPDITTP